MKIIIMSDTHGSRKNFDEIMRRETDRDMLIHLGDVEGDEDYIERKAGCPVYMVAGNNDFFSSLPREEEIQIGLYKVLLTHGHYYYVSCGTKTLKEIGRQRRTHIVMYGHTHRPDLDLSGDVVVINPGSLSYPRQEGRRATYVVMETDREGKADFSLKYV